MKKSNKPFKSGNKIATVFQETMNPYTGKPAYRLDDDSIVDQQQCIPIEEDNNNKEGV